LALDSATLWRYVVHMSNDASFDPQGVFEKTSVKCRIIKGWDGAGRTGQYLGRFFSGQWWAIVKWDDEEDPDLHKTCGLDLFRG